MAASRAIFALPLLYQQLFYCPPPPAVPAAATINAGVSVTTGWASGRTLHYQAKIFVAAPPDVLSPPVAASQSFSVTTGQATTKTRFYQALVQPIVVPVAAVVTAPTLDWQQPFSRLPPAAAPTTRYSPFVPPPPSQITADEWLQPFQKAVQPRRPVHTQPVLAYGLPAQITADEWLQPFRRAVQTPNPVYTQPVYGYQPEAVVVSNLTTTLEWMPAWTGPPRELQSLAGGFVYAAPPQVVSNLTTTLEWMAAWQGPPRIRPVHTQPVLGLIPSNLTTTLEWMVAWKGPPRPLQPLASGPVYATTPSNLTTTLEWMPGWQGPPRYRPLGNRPYQPFVPREAVLDNTVTPDAWLYRFEKAIPAPKPVHTQPVFGYPYVSASNLTTTLEWQIAWQGPPRYLQPLAGGYVNPNPVAPTVSNLTTSLEWLIAWQGPPRIRPVHTQPVLGLTPSNLTTTLEWQIAWQGPPRYLQRLAAGVTYPTPPSNLTTTLEWQIAWQGPPRTLLRLPGGQPFIPKEAALENTVPPQWNYSFTKAAPVPPVWATQPLYGYPYETVPNLTTTLEWLMAWPRSVVLQWLTQYGGNVMPSFPYEGVIFVPPVEIPPRGEVWWPRTLEETYWHLGKKKLELEAFEREEAAEEAKLKKLEQQAAKVRSKAKQEAIRHAAEELEMQRFRARQALANEIQELLLVIELIKQEEDEAILLLMANDPF